MWTILSVESHGPSHSSPHSGTANSRLFLPIKGQLGPSHLLYPESDPQSMISAGEIFPWSEALTRPRPLSFSMSERISLLVLQSHITLAAFPCYKSKPFSGLETVIQQVKGGAFSPLYVFHYLTELWLSLLWADVCIILFPGARGYRNRDCVAAKWRRGTGGQEGHHICSRKTQWMRHGTCICKSPQKSRKLLLHYKTK